MGFCQQTAELWISTSFIRASDGGTLTLYFLRRFCSDGGSVGFCSVSWFCWSRLCCSWWDKHFKALFLIRPGMEQLWAAALGWLQPVSIRTSKRGGRCWPRATCPASTQNRTCKPAEMITRPCFHVLLIFLVKISFRRFYWHEESNESEPEPSWIRGLIRFTAVILI